MIMNKDISFELNSLLSWSFFSSRESILNTKAAIVAVTVTKRSLITSITSSRYNHCINVTVTRKKWSFMKARDRIWKGFFPLDRVFSSLLYCFTKVKLKTITFKCRSILKDSPKWVLVLGSIIIIWIRKDIPQGFRFPGDILLLRMTVTDILWDFPDLIGDHLGLKTLSSKWYNTIPMKA